MIIQPQQKMDLLKCQISVAATYMGAEPPIIAIQDIFFGAIQQGNSTSSRMLLIRFDVENCYRIKPKIKESYKYDSPRNMILEANKN